MTVVSRGNSMAVGLNKMKVVTPEISWHERDPIYSVDFQPGNHSIQRLASGGVDKIVRIWQMTLDSEGKGNIEFLSNLRRHTATVNVVRFSKNGEILASAGDDSSIILWKQSDVSTPATNIFADEDAEESKESWVCHKTLRGHLGDVADMSWSKDSRYLVSGSVDNSAIVWDVKKAQKLAFFNEHKSYVQGVAFDPLGDYIATLSSDRSLRIFSLASKNIVNNVSKMPPISVDNQNPSESKPKPMRIFQDDSLRSFFRRLEFTCDGQLLLTPAGCVEMGDKVVNSSFIFVRGAFARPALYLPSGEKSTTVVRGNPQLFQLRKASNIEENNTDNRKEWEKNKSVFSLPYRMVFAVATEDSVLLYDTQQKMPVGLLKNIHYHQISDLSWTGDGKALIISSTDGFCTIATFEEGELGDLYSEGQESKDEKIATSPSAAKVGSKECVDESQEESSGKEQISEIPFSRYSEVAQGSVKEIKGEKINTKLNIRRVTKSPRATNSQDPEVQSKEKGNGPTDGAPGPKVVPVSGNSADEKKKASGINTILNIRRVGKDGSTKIISSAEGKETGQNESISPSSKEEKKDGEINTVLNIRRVGKSRDSQTSEKPNEDQRVMVKSKDCEGTKSSDGAEEKGIVENVNKVGISDKGKSPLSEKIDQIHIGDVDMKEETQGHQTESAEKKSATHSEQRPTQIDDVIMIEEGGES